MATQAERLFEQYCTQRQIEFRRIPEGAQRTPDYEVVLGGRTAAVEVKQLEPNDRDRALLEELRIKGHAGGSVNMGRARSSILDGTKQLRAFAKGRMPGIVLLYDATGFAHGNLDPYSLAFCLYGPEKVHYLVAADSADDETLGMSRGGDSVATAKHNTTLSAVAVLARSGPDGRPEIAVYHNIHAALPLTPGQCAAHGIPQFRFAPPSEGLMPEWLPVGS